MNATRASAQNLSEMTPLQSLMVAYAPASGRVWQRLCWLLDQRLADVVRRANEPTIAAIRLAWWDAVLVEGDRAKGGGEPLVEAWRAAAPDGSAAFAEQLIDGWRVLLSTEPLTVEDLAEFARKRGGGLFGLIGHGVPGLEDAGAAWALWDLAAHMQDEATAQAAIALAARDFAHGISGPRGRALKPLRLLHDLALADIRAGRVPHRGFEGRHYRRLLWRALVG
jgi:phytoene synthase